MKNKNKVLPTIVPAVMSARDACTYLSVGRAHFFGVIRPLVKPVDMSAPGTKRPLLRWRTADLDKFLADRVQAA